MSACAHLEKKQQSERFQSHHTMHCFTSFHCGKKPFPTSFQEIGDNISVESALKHIKPEYPDFNKSLSSIKTKIKESLDHGLKRDEAVALYLCSAKSDNDKIHRMLNEALVSEDTKLIEPWSRFLKLIFTGSKKLPSTKTITVWCSMDVETANKLKQEEEFVWWTVTSCYSSKKPLRRHSSEHIIPYSIDVMYAKTIPSFRSDIEATDEIILLPGTCVRVQRSSFDSSKKTYDIHLIQIFDDESQPTDESSMKHQNELTSRARRRLQRAGLSTDNDGNKVDKPLILEIIFADGGHYKAHRSNSNPSGYTSILAKKSNTFQDDEADHQATGKGTQTWPNGDEYKGSFKNGRKNGHGTLNCKDGYTYIGSWEKDRMEGDGTSTWRNGYRYTGNHSHGVIDGKGTIVSKSGETYEGNLIDGKANGRGKRSWPDGDRYEGDFKNDKKHGEGTYRFAQGGFYSGSWVDDQMQGQGKLQWPSGNEYEGNFEKGQRHGQGQLTVNNAVVLKGKWKKDQFIDS